MANHSDTAGSPGVPRRHRRPLLRGPGPHARFSKRLRIVLDRAIDEATAGSPGGLDVLDAGCGHKSPLVPMRRRIRRLVGSDLHAPDRIPPYLDEFVPVDLCETTSAMRPATFDLVLANFVLEHLTHPVLALRNLGRWLRPGGVLVATTVNRRHPFVAAYFLAPGPVQSRLQPVLKATPADAHPLVGSCNDPGLIRSALDEAGFEDIEVEAVGNLARAWNRHRTTSVLGRVGDLLTVAAPTRRSTIIIVARRPALVAPA